MDLSERKLKILQAIVGDYIRSAEPVGSRTLSKKYDMGISAATIRNEMSDLEEMGLLTHPHTSAGRVPSDKAYRLYVNSLMKKYELPEEEKKVIEDQLSSNITELDRDSQESIASSLRTDKADGVCNDTDAGRQPSEIREDSSCGSEECRADDGDGERKGYQYGDQAA